MAADLDLLVCENLEREVRVIVDTEQWTDIAVTVSPALCPGTLRKVEHVRRFIAKNTHPSTDRIVIGCGGLRDAASEPAGPGQTTRRAMASCFDLIAPADVTTGFTAQGGFLITPGWLERWPEYMAGWGFDRQTARDFVADTASRLVLLDTKVHPDAQERLREFADFVDRPTQVFIAGLDHLRLHVTNRVLGWRLKQEQTACERSLVDMRRRLADYGMSFDLLSGFTGLESESDVIDAIMWLFTMLFTPKSLTYYPLDGDVDHAPIRYPDRASDSLAQNDTAPTESKDVDEDVAGAGDAPEAPELPDLTEPYVWTSPQQEGFVMRIGPEEAPVGALRVEGSTFPQYMQHYVNLALSLSEVCALAIADARLHGRLHSTITQLEQALASVKTLSGLLPICAGCKKIRDDEGFWTQVESYVAQHTAAEFTHGMCPDCLAEYGLTDQG